jgi:flagellar motor protein MotB
MKRIAVLSRSKGDGLFASGSTVARENYAPVIDRVAQAMNNVSGKILVVGYSDNGLFAAALCFQL